MEKSPAPALCLPGFPVTDFRRRVRPRRLQRRYRPGFSPGSLFIPEGFVYAPGSQNENIQFLKKLALIFIFRKRRAFFLPSIYPAPGNPSTSFCRRLSTFFYKNLQNKPGFMLSRIENDCLFNRFQHHHSMLRCQIKSFSSQVMVISCAKATTRLSPCKTP